MNIYTEEMLIIFKDIFEIEISIKEEKLYGADLIQKLYFYFLNEFKLSIQKINMVSPFKDFL